MKSLLKKHKFLIITLMISSLVVLWFILVSEGEYGTTLFFTIPASTGFLIGYSTTFNGAPKDKIKKGLTAFFKIMLVVALFSGFLIAIGLEGAICILMAYPFLIIPITLAYILGLFIGNADKNIKQNSLILILLINPTTYIYDSYTEPIQEEITSEVIVNTSAENIWDDLSTKISFKNKPNILFEKGISYPKSIEMLNKKGELSYHCVTNNDTIALKILEFDSKAKVVFKPERQTIPMKEVTPHDSINPKHLHNYFFVHYGEISLESITPTTTKLEATTSYSYKIAPKWYWKLWSDEIIDRMQMHVLNSIKSKYEN